MTRNKELTWGSRPEGDVTKAALIGNRVEIGNL